jgi:hypothetical protein
VSQPCSANDCPDRLTVRIGLSRGALDLSAAEDGGPAFAVITDPGDGLRLDLVENVVGYRRLTVLPRIRWAGTGIMVPGPSDRVRILERGVDPDAVVLGEMAPPGSGSEAKMRVLEDSGDEIRVRVATPGPGYVVVADPLQEAWEAEVDGEPVALHSADHAVVAVLVPEGGHEVRLVYDPPGWRVGLAVAAASLLVLLGAAVVARPRRARGRPRRRGDESIGHAASR